MITFINCPCVCVCVVVVCLFVCCVATNLYLESLEVVQHSKWTSLDRLIAIHVTRTAECLMISNSCQIHRYAILMGYPRLRVPAKYFFFTFCVELVCCSSSKLSSTLTQSTKMYSFHLHVIFFSKWLSATEPNCMVAPTTIATKLLLFVTAGPRARLRLLTDP